jgi:hypothetical protein
MTPCYVLIPLAYNDGTRVEKEIREKILDEFFIEFNGYTIDGIKRGAYRRHDTGEKQVEVTQRICVLVDGEEGVRKLRALLADIGRLLGQEFMYFEVATGSTVEFVPPSQKGGQ